MAFVEPITACALTLACLGAPAQPAGAYFELRIHTADRSTGAVSLRCQPAGGTHPKPVHACTELAAVNGHLERLQSRSHACTLIYQPVDVSAYGHWSGEPIAFAATFTNPCLAAVGTNGGIFDFLPLSTGWRAP
jgi:hypothetical protein